MVAPNIPEIINDLSSAQAKLAIAQTALQQLQDEIAATVAATPSASPTPSITVAAPQPVWADEFDDGPVVGALGMQPDPAKWATHYHWPAWTLADNKEDEIYWDPDPAYPWSPFAMQNSILTITADRAQSHPSMNAQGQHFISGMLCAAPAAAWTTGTKPPPLVGFDFLFGRIEARIRLPKGTGLWPGFWLLPSDRSWPPEIDILETFGATNPAGEGANAGHWQLHDGAGSPGGWWSIGPVFDIFDWHVYALDWTRDYLTWFVDGAQAAQVPTPPDLREKRLFPIIDLACGGPGSWPGATPLSAVPAGMAIDYVRVYAPQ